MNARLVVLALVLCACAKHPGGAAGVWRAQVAVPGDEAQNLAFSLSATGSSLSGTVLGVPRSGLLSIESGRIAGDDVSFAIRTPSRQGDTTTFTFVAKLAGNRMQGVIEAREGQRIAFTATRTAATPRALVAGDIGGGVRRATRAVSDSGPPNPQGANPTPQNAEAAVLAAFDRYEVVGMGILSYANQDFDQFILDLIRNPAFPAKVDDIVVECGNSLYQPVLDRYVAGDSVPLADVQRVWRNTTQPFCGVTTFYEELFPLVRRVNATLAGDRKLRVLAGDPPVDWSRVRTRDDLRSVVNRDSNIAAVMEHEVLAKHRKALMIFGLLHLVHGGFGAVGRVEQAGYPNRTFVVMAHNGFGNDSPLGKYDAGLERRLAGWPVPSLVTLRGTWLDDLPWPYFLPGVERAGPVSASVDGYLYLGPGDVLLNDPIPARAVLDTAYMAELRRRARIGGRPEGAEMVLREAARPTVFFNEPEGR